MPHQAVAHQTRQVRLGDNGTSPGEGVSVTFHVAHCERLLNVTERAKARLGDISKPVCGALFPTGVLSFQWDPLGNGRGMIPFLPMGDRSLLFGSAPAALTPAELEERKSRNVRAPPPLHAVSKCNLSVT